MGFLDKKCWICRTCSMPIEVSGRILSVSGESGGSKVEIMKECMIWVYYNVYICLLPRAKSL